MLQNFFEAALTFMSSGVAVQLKSKGDVVMRLWPDISITGGNINMTRAQELIPGTTDITPENAAELVQKAGLTLKVKAEIQPKFSALLREEKPELEFKGPVRVYDKVLRTDASTGTIDTSTGTADTSTGDNTGGGDDGLGG